MQRFHPKRKIQRNELAELSVLRLYSASHFQSPYAAQGMQTEYKQKGQVQWAAPEPQLFVLGF